MNIQNDPEARSKVDRFLLLLAFVSGAVVFIVYLGALKNGFVNWDDNSLVYSNPNIRSIDLAFIKWAFTDVVIASWYPLTLISFAIDYAVWGLDPKGYHLTNNIFHAVNTALVFLLVSRLFIYSVRESDQARHGAIAAALVTALLFGLHPLRVESVAWVSERKDVLYAFFFLLSLIAYFAYRYSGPEEGSKRRVFYLLSLVLFASSLMSKAMAVSLPLVLVIVDLYILKARSIAIKPVAVIRDKIPFFVLSIIFALFTISTHGESGTLVSLDVHSPLVRLFLTLRGYVFYMIKTVIPSGLAPFYPLPSSIHIFSFEYVGSFILFLVITALSIYLIRKRAWLAAAWAFYIVTLLPVTGLFQIGAHSGADRYTYLPALGLFILPGLIAGAIFMRPGIKNIKALVIIVAAVILAVSVGLTHKQIKIWKDSVTLWQYEVSLYPDSVPVAYINLGRAYDDLGLRGEALSAYKQAIDIDPDNTVAHNNLGALYRGSGKPDLAIEHFKAALTGAVKHEYIERILENLGDALLDSGRGAEAAKRYEELLKRMSEAPLSARSALREANIYNKLGVAYASSADMDKAGKSFSKALELNPAHKGAKENLKKLGSL
ncbi:MAG: tetratricopeptide repeat protein [Thermodesulfobacteriota bacterium]